MPPNTQDDEIKQPSVPTMDQTGKRRWLYPDRRKGANASKRKWTAAVLIVLYLVAPWFQWKGTPLLRFDAIEKKAYLFGQILHLSDAALIAPVLAAFALLLFFATSIKGRIWCSYGCPQTVFVEWLIRPIEELTEGSAHHRRRMDAGPLTLSRITRKALKHLLFLAVASIVANTFLSFFFGPARIATWMVSPPQEHPVAFLVMSAVMLGFYLDLAWFREQFCAFLCPYARFQSVIIDHDTPTVVYDSVRGDPRGQTKKTAVVPEKKFGDCIDCQLCVRVCPTGIDIRNGLQLECIMCARCMDACDMVMTNLGRPQALIKIASQNEISGEKRVPFWKRPKTLAYAAALLLMTSAGLVRVLNRNTLDVTILRAPGAPYTKMPDGRFGNLFIIRATNNSAHPIRLDFKVKSPDEAELLCAQCQVEIQATNDLRASAIVMFEHKLANKVLTIMNSSTGDEATSVLIAPN